MMSLDLLSQIVRLVLTVQVVDHNAIVLMECYASLTQGYVMVDDVIQIGTE